MRLCYSVVLRLRIAPIVLAALWISICCHDLMAGIRVVALSGQPAVGTEEANTFASLDTAEINERGEVGINASISGPTVTTTNSRGFWLERAGQLQLATRQGQLVFDGATGDALRSIEAAGVDDFGHVAFRGSFSRNPGLTPRTAIWKSSNAGLAAVAQAGESAVSGPNGATFNFIGLPKLAGDGSLAFDAGASLAGGANYDGVWGYVPGETVHPLVLGGDAVPGFGGEVRFFDFDLQALNRNGDAVFEGAFSGPAVEAGANSGVWIARRNTEPKSVALEGNPAVSLAPGEVLGEFRTARINYRGDVVFHADVNNAAGAGVRSGIWVADQTLGMRLVAKSNSPDFIGRVSFSDFTTPLINAEGNVTFVARFRPAPGFSTVSGLWTESAAGLQLVASGGLAAPGTTDGVVYRIGGNFLTQFSQVSVNARGQIVFQTLLEGTGVDASNDEGIWAFHPGIGVSLIAREGDAFEVSPGDVRTIQRVLIRGYSGNEDGGFAALNDQGHFAFQLAFADGSTGIFVSTLAPEPASMISLLVLICTLSNSRVPARRHR